MTTNPELDQLGRLVGAWTTEATHPAVPGVVVRGTVEFEWLEGERFLIQRAGNDHPDFPDFIAILGVTNADRVDPGASEPAAADKPGMTMHYFDSRGVFRVYEVSIDDEALRIWRNAPGFSQRFTGAFADSGNTTAGTWQLCRDDVNWHDDLAITYRRRTS
jgi:hypothetical protein